MGEHNFDEFHRGYMGGQLNAARKILAAANEMPLGCFLIEQIKRVCVDELDLDVKDLEEIEPNG